MTVTIIIILTIFFSFLFGFTICSIVTASKIQSIYEEKNEDYEKVIKSLQEELYEVQKENLELKEKIND